MRKHKFETYDDYLKAQVKLTRKKLKIFKFHRCFTSHKVIDAIYKYHKTKVKNGLCHGVRKGKELDLFEEKFTGKWVGTEIVPEICDGERIFNQDFNKLNQDWIGSFDVIYSNSLDHSKDPYKTVKVWLSCLSKTGRLYIEWTLWHNKLGKQSNKADCFAATSEEYRSIFKLAGKVEDVLLIPDVAKKNNFKFIRHIFVVY